jgi:hypothetical protein
MINKKTQSIIGVMSGSAFCFWTSATSLLAMGERSLARVTGTTRWQRGGRHRVHPWLATVPR